jgi:type VI secretion system protein ImpA
MILADLSADLPAGDNLELDPDFDAMERAARGRPETQYGDTINPAIAPDWAETASIAERLLQRTRDLRVMTHLAVARLHLTGIPGFADMLSQIREQLESRWQQVHPQLDPEDGNDTTLRSNALFRLQDPANVLRTLRDLPLAVSPKTGPLTWRDVAVFNGQAEPDPGREKPTEAFIIGGFQDTNQERLHILRGAVDAAVREVAAIPAAFEAHPGSGPGPNFDHLAKLLRDIQGIIRRFGAAAVVKPEAAATVEQEEVLQEPVRQASQPTHTAPRGTPIGVRSVAEIATRGDALYCMELAAAYFRAHEPSSPVPMLIARAARLASMEFLDILRDLAPDGLAQAQAVTGPSAD